MLENCKKRLIPQNFFFFLFALDVLGFFLLLCPWPKKIRGSIILECCCIKPSFVCGYKLQLCLHQDTEIPAELCHGIQGRLNLDDDPILPDK